MWPRVSLTARDGSPSLRGDGPSSRAQQRERYTARDERGRGTLQAARSARTRGGVRRVRLKSMSIQVASEAVRAEG